MSNKKRAVTELDLRDPRYGPGDPDEFEFREDGSIARKDRWEQGMRSVAFAVNEMRKGWEIQDVVDKVQDLGWYSNLLCMELPELIQGWPVPKPLTRWVHRESNNEYIVLGMSNLESTRPEKYPISVVYMRLEDRSIWGRPLELWHASYHPKQTNV